MLAPRRSRSLFFGALVSAGLLGGDARGFPYVVQSGDTLASIAERFYGRIEHERILVAANGLDLEGGLPITPGLRLEVPSLSYRRVKAGETWETLARDLLGSARRATTLSLANRSSPWLLPEEGREILIPYNLRVVVGRHDTLVTIAHKFLGHREQAWMLDQYNGLKGRTLVRGDTVLVPLTDLPLTEEGKRAAANALGSGCSEATGRVREAQLRVERELPALVSDVRRGRYVEAVVRGNRFLATADLGRRTLAIIYRQLLEAYVALDAAGLAAHACDEWLRLEPGTALDPVTTSPKILRACERKGVIDRAGNAGTGDGGSE